MKRQIFATLALVAGAAFLGAAAYAASISISFTAGQNTYTQTTLIPKANADKCAEFKLSAGCSSAQLVAAGCVVAPFSSVTKSNLVYRDCTIYTQDAAGEALFGADQLYQHLIAAVSADLELDIAASCTSFKLATTIVQNNVCTQLGRPNGCRICR